MHYYSKVNQRPILPSMTLHQQSCHLPPTQSDPSKPRSSYTPSSSPLPKQKLINNQQRINPNKRYYPPNHSHQPTSPSSNPQERREKNRELTPHQRPRRRNQIHSLSLNTLVRDVLLLHSEGLWFYGGSGTPAD